MNTRHNMDESQIHYAQRKKAVPKGYILYDSTHDKTAWTEKRSVVLRDWGWGRG